MKTPLRQTRFLLAETDPRLLPAAQTEVAFVGRSNVGKSSAICALCDNRSLARVSKTPGRTRGINIFEAAKDRWLVDLPGYGYAEAPEKEREYWPKMIGNYLSGRSSMALILVLVDGERGIGPADLSLLNWLREQKAPSRIVGTKIDRLGGSRQADYRRRMAGSLGLLPDEIHWISGKTGAGIDALRAEIVSFLGL